MISALPGGRYECVQLVCCSRRGPALRFPLFRYNRAQTPPHITSIAPASLPSIRIDQRDIVPQARPAVLRQIGLDIRQIGRQRLPTRQVQVQLIRRGHLVLGPVRRRVPLSVVGGDAIGNEIWYRRIAGPDEIAPDLHCGVHEVGTLIGCWRAEVRRHISAVKCYRD